MAAKQDNSAQIVQIKGRLSYPAFTHKEALALNDRSDPQYKKSDPAEVKPTYSLLLTQTEWEKLKAHLLDVFLPWCVEQEKEQGRSRLTAAQAKKLTRVIEAEDWEIDKIPGFLRPIAEKTVDLAPECVVGASISSRVRRRPRKVARARALRASKPDVATALRSSQRTATAGSPSAPATWPGRRGWTPRR